jgi:hypothetical protein
MSDQERITKLEQEVAALTKTMVTLKDEILLAARDEREAEYQAAMAPTSG